MLAIKIGLFFLGLSGTLYGQALGTALWRQPVGGNVIGLPSVQAGSVVVLSDDGTVRAFSGQGNPLWEYSAGELSPYITRSREGMNYVCTSGGVLIALNRIGRELWRADLGAPLIGPILIGWDGRLFAPTDRRISCYTPAGTLLWYKNFDHAIAVPPHQDNQGGLLFALDNGELLHINEFGKSASRQLPSTPSFLLSLADPGEKNSEKRGENFPLPVLVFYETGELEVSGADYPPIPGLTSPAIGGAYRQGKAAIALQDGQVLLLSPGDGTFLWTAKSAISPIETGSAGDEAGVLYDDRGVYLLSQAGSAAFDEPGQRRWFIRIIGATAVPIFSDDGMLYSGGRDGYLYAYRLETRTLFRKQSLYGPPPEGSYQLGAPFPDRKDYTNRFSEIEVRTQFARIRKALEEGTVGEQEKEFTAFLMEAAGSVRNSIKIAPAKPPVHFGERIQALRLLSVLGSQEIIPFLVDLFKNEPDPLVQAAAASAIGAIGVDPEGLALGAFTLGVVAPGYIKDESVLLAVAGAVGDLCRFSGPPVMHTGAAILVALAGGDKPIRVRNRALEVIRALRN
ncbi:MAG: PQQ-binding-like beta-propeller repeat protein [Spirochaetaceae bacterium]|jgi:outer membrane protein assembly factor BamB|nr:PQQ-binding-like beta-propeller repeat protein [Spirochaetaceae bacterium]